MNDTLNKVMVGQLVESEDGTVSITQNLEFDNVGAILTGDRVIVYFLHYVKNVRSTRFNKHEEKEEKY